MCVWIHLMLLILCPACRWITDLMNRISEWIHLQSCFLLYFSIFQSERCYVCECVLYIYKCLQIHEHWSTQRCPVWIFDQSLWDDWQPKGGNHGDPIHCPRLLRRTPKCCETLGCQGSRIHPSDKWSYRWSKGCTWRTGKSPFFIGKLGKSTISMAIFNSKL